MVGESEFHTPRDGVFGVGWTVEEKKTYYLVGGEGNTDTSNMCHSLSPLSVCLALLCSLASFIFLITAYLRL